MLVAMLPQRSRRSRASQRPYNACSICPEGGNGSCRGRDHGGDERSLSGWVEYKQAPAVVEAGDAQDPWYANSWLSMSDDRVVQGLCNDTTCTICTICSTLTASCSLPTHVHGFVALHLPVSLQSCHHGFCCAYNRYRAWLPGIALRGVHNITPRHPLGSRLSHRDVYRLVLTDWIHQYRLSPRTERHCQCLR